MSHLLAPLAEWIRDVVEGVGYVGIALLIVLENVFPPIPSELVLPLAGFLVSEGRFGFPQVMLASTLGSVVGAVILYYIGLLFGEERLRAFVRRFGRLLFLSEADVDRAESWFIRHGGKAIFFGRLFPVVRSLISVPAGLARMSLLPFIIYTAIGSSMWNGMLVGAGWLLGTQWENVLEYVQVLEYATIAIILGLVLRFILRRVARRRHA